MRNLFYPCLLSILLTTLSAQANDKLPANLAEQGTQSIQDLPEEDIFQQATHVAPIKKTPTVSIDSKKNYIPKGLDLNSVIEEALSQKNQPAKKVKKEETKPLPSYSDKEKAELKGVSSKDLIDRILSQESLMQDKERNLTADFSLAKATQDKKLRLVLMKEREALENVWVHNQKKLDQWAKGQELDKEEETIQQVASEDLEEELTEEELLTTQSEEEQEVEAIKEEELSNETIEVADNLTEQTEQDAESSLTDRKTANIKEEKEVQEQETADCDGTCQQEKQENLLVGLTDRISSLEDSMNKIQDNYQSVMQMAMMNMTMMNSMMNNMMAMMNNMNQKAAPVQQGEQKKSLQDIIDNHYQNYITALPQSGYMATNQTPFASNYSPMQDKQRPTTFEQSPGFFQTGPVYENYMSPFDFSFGAVNNAQRMPSAQELFSTAPRA